MHRHGEPDDRAGAQAAGGRSALSTWAAELGMAIFAAVVGAVVIYGSVEQGIGWGETGPDPGYFPFYIGVLIVLSSVGTAVITLLKGRPALGSFASVGQIRRAAAVFLPTVAYVAAMRFVGLYVASALFIAAYMRWVGKYRIGKALGVGIGVSVFFFALFEFIFNVPLAKGPLENLMGFY
ncbi:MAG: tripartite tricarboxylate transporter TctB family protein [Gammaproteobacteria bacterium]